MDGKIVQTAGRDRLGEFAPEFAHFNDDVLFGENWNNPDLDLKNPVHDHSSCPGVIRHYRFVSDVSFSKC